LRGSLATCVVIFAATPAAPPPTAHAKNGDTHVIGQGSSHVTHDITVYGWDETVFFHNGDPFIWDRGRELGMTNRLQRVGR
jgi:hypothetical protein